MKIVHFRRYSIFDEHEQFVNLLRACGFTNLFATDYYLTNITAIAIFEKKISVIYGGREYQFAFIHHTDVSDFKERNNL